ncbi:hypothetical protein [Psychrobacter lutiphocae]|uniref:hypothetical protein n=1 Tax=Psychrobacter lutiphocae TaxID=540500 RepID=UPI0003636254|nr:hypothetical protein [Psychrobacter lutiphocae]
MFSLFIKKSQADKKSSITKSQFPELPSLDQAFYPLCWQAQYFDSALQFLRYLLHSDVFKGLEHQPDYAADFQQYDKISSKNKQKVNAEDKIAITAQDSWQQAISWQQAFSQRLQDNRVYQDWTNFTVFGRYVQRSFSVFYQQSEDVFNADMPELLRHELMRHTQRLPSNQVLLFAGQIPRNVRQEKLLMTTVNPVQALVTAIHLALANNQAQAKQHRQNSAQKRKQPIIINLITTVSDQVKAFAIKHNKRTQEGLRNEVMVLDFNQLILVKEDRLAWTGEIKQEADSTQSDIAYLIRHYHIS